MENATDALMMGFAIFVFVLALSLTIVLFTQIRQTSDVVLQASDKTNYYEYVGDRDNNNIRTERIVGVETIIPTLFRYNNESLSIIIVNNDEEDISKWDIIQVFDLTVESNLGELDSIDSMDSEDLKLEKSAIYQLFKNNANVGDLFKNIKKSYENVFKNNITLPTQAPWQGNNDYINTRIKLFINGTNDDSMNSVKITYDNFFNKYKNKQFKESFQEFLITEDYNVDFDEELTGGASGVSKTIIVYRKIN